MGSASSTRTYTWVVVALALVGVGLLTSVAILAGQKIDEEASEHIRVAGRKKRDKLDGLLQRLWGELRVGKATRDLPMDEREGWDEMSGPLKEALGLLDLKAMRVRTREGREVWNFRARSPEGPPLSGANRPFALLEVGDSEAAMCFPFPRSEFPSEGVEVCLWMDLGQTIRDRGRLTDYLGFLMVCVGVGLYVLGAVAMLFSRAETRLRNRAREKTTRLRAMGEVAGGIAHEVRNPINAISLSVQYLEKLGERGDRQPSASDYARIHLELGKIRKVIDNFVKFARIRDMVIGPMDLGDVLEEVLDRQRVELDARNVDQELVKEGDLTCSGDKEKLTEVFAAVVQNASDAMREQNAGHLRLRASVAGRNLRVTVRDTGEVREEHELRNIFEPYFTDRDQAMGLGMTVAKTFVESHGGTIEAALAQGGGCVVTVSLPRKAF